MNQFKLNPRQIKKFVSILLSIDFKENLRKVVHKIPKFEGFLYSFFEYQHKIWWDLNNLEKK